MIKLKKNQYYIKKEIKKYQCKKFINLNSTKNDK